LLLKMAAGVLVGVVLVEGWFDAVTLKRGKVPFGALRFDTLSSLGSAALG
jgi:hypothetical protein